MKRFHAHVSVGDLPHGITFYSKLSGAEPPSPKLTTPSG